MPSVSPDTRVIRRIGDYELLEEIARGGMGIVFRARQISLNREVAVKLMRDGALATSEDVRRFRAEAAAAAQLQHPGIVAIHEVGEQDGQHYFAMDLVEGPNLAELTRNGPVPVRRAVELTAKIADAVQHAHERGLLHRDLKPSNVLIDATGEPHVADFGLVLPLEGSSDLTQTGRILGTPGYMAPEQAAGRGGTVGPSADVYGLGALLFHLLTGRPPFVGENVTEVLHQVARTEPLSPRLLNPSVPVDLARVCLKCLEKNPSRRYASARAVAEELERWQRGEPTLARPVLAIERLWLWSLRNRPLAVVSAVALLALLTATVVSTVAAVRLKRERDLTRGALWQSWLDQARAERLTGVAGARTRGLQAITNAAHIRSTLALRNEAIGTLSLTEIADGVEHGYPTGAYDFPVFDASLKVFALSSANGEVLVGEVRSGRVTARLPTQAGHVHFLAMSPDGRHAGVFMDAGIVALWEIATVRELWRDYVPPVHGATPIAFHPAQPVLVLRTATNQLRLLDLNSGETKGTIALPWEPMRFAFSPDGGKVALNRGDRCEAWDVVRQSSLGAFTNRTCLDPIVWHPDGRHLAVGDCSGGVVFWDVLSGAREIWTGDPHHTFVLAFNPSGTLLLSGHWNNVSELWDIASGQRSTLHQGGVAYQFSSDGMSAAWVSTLGPFGTCSVNEPAHLRSLSVPLGTPHPGKIAFNRDGRWLARIHASGLHLWDVATARLLAVSAGANKGVEVSFARDGQSLVTARENQFWLWPLTTNTVGGPPKIGAPQKISRNNLRPLDAEVGEKGLGHLFPSDPVNAAQVYFADLDHPAELYQLDNPPNGAFSISQTTNWIATYGPQGLQIRRLDGEPLSIATKNHGGVLLLSPDSRSLAHAASGVLEMFATDTGQLRWQRPTTTAVWTTFCFSHDGAVLAVCGLSSPHVWLIDAATGNELATLTPPGNPQVVGLAFSPDDRTFAVAHGRHILLWDLPALRRQLAGIGMSLDWTAATKRSLPDNGRR